MTSDRQSLPSLRAVFDAARTFGLTDEEAWRAVDDAVWSVGADGTLGDCLEELAAALASDILDKQRRRLRFERPSVSSAR
jgi:hypothetical protein